MTKHLCCYYQKYHENQRKMKSYQKVLVFFRNLVIQCRCSCLQKQGRDHFSIKWFLQTYQSFLDGPNEIKSVESLPLKKTKPTFWKVKVSFKSLQIVSPHVFNMWVLMLLSPWTTLLGSSLWIIVPISLDESAIVDVVTWYLEVCCSWQ